MQSLNCWTAREVPMLRILKASSHLISTIVSEGKLTILYNWEEGHLLKATHQAPVVASLILRWDIETTAFL